MSYGFALALQAALFSQLSEALDVPVFDALPAGELPATYVLIGAEEVRDASDGSGRGAEHRLRLSIITSLPGFAEAKGVAVAISAAFEGVLPALSVGRLVALGFLRAEAKRLESKGLRQIDLIYRARTCD